MRKLYIVFSIAILLMLFALYLGLTMNPIFLLGAVSLGWYAYSRLTFIRWLNEVHERAVNQEVHEGDIVFVDE